VDDVEVIPRKEFVREFGENYQSGQHATFLGPSGRGKTRLVGQLLIASATPDHQAVVLHGKIKGRDKTIESMSAAADMPIVESWPPSRYRKWRSRHSRGYILLPLSKAGNTASEENALVAREFKKAIRANYHTSHSKPRITVVNEAHQAHNDLKLKGDCEAPLMRGRPDNAVWSEVQRCRYVSYMVYDQAEHVFIFYDPDVDNQRRYSEIGGVDPQYVRDLASGLKTHTVRDGSTISQCLYFRRSGNYLCIVDT
jgi:hypothetical protein